MHFKFWYFEFKIGESYARRLLESDSTNEV